MQPKVGQGRESERSSPLYKLPQTKHTHSNYQNPLDNCLGRAMLRAVCATTLSSSEGCSQVLNLRSLVLGGSDTTEGNGIGASRHLWWQHCSYGPPRPPGARRTAQAQVFGLAITVAGLGATPPWAGLASRPNPRPDHSFWHRPCHPIQEQN